jgi:glycosyltransferase involved in cell wall biosynthesis
VTATTTAPLANDAAESGSASDEVAPPRPRGSLVVFSDDWGRHPSSCQHIVRRLASRYDVLWVNTIGTRGPKLDWATLQRAVGKLLPKRGASGSSPRNDDAPVKVVNPLMWPWFRRRHDRWLNRRALVHALAPSIAALPRPRVVVTTIPLVADLVGELDVDSWVYYCVDDLAAWPGLESEVLQSMERELIAKADAFVAVSEVLQDRLAAAGRASTLVSHGVDLDHWTSSARARRRVAAIDAAPRPCITFWGLIDERLDADWLLTLADSLTTGSIVVAGPNVTIDQRLQRHPRITFPGAVAYDDLPALAAQSAVLVMPYRHMPATEAMQPLKLKEYLATGLPCVVRRLPATEPWQDAADVVEHCDEFVRCVHERLRSGVPASQQAARQRLAAESWDAKARVFEAAIAADMAPAVGRSRNADGHD